MAKEKKEAKVTLERVYNIPLRKKYMKAPRWKRTNRAVKAIREFAAKHMKSDNVKIGKYLNLNMWKHGAKNPPHHIKVNCQKLDDNSVMVELVGAPVEKPEEKKKKPKEEAKKEEKKTEEEVEISVKDALGGEDVEKKDIKEEKAEKAKEIEKEEIKELKKELKKAPKPKEAPMPKRVEQHPSAPMQKG